MIVKQKDLILFNFYYSNLKESKVRPAIVISNDYLNSLSEDCIIAPLTTMLKDVPYSVIIDNEDLESGELIKTSRIRADKIITIDKNLIIMKFGILNEDSFSLIKTELISLF